MLAFSFSVLSEAATQWLGGVVIGALLLLAYLVATHWSRGKH